MLCYNHYEKWVGDIMKKISNGLCSVGLIAFFGIIPLVNAASTCNYETQIKLRQAANNVNVNQETGWHGTGEFEESEVEEETGNTEFEIMDVYSNVSIYNITEDIYIEITNKNDAEIKRYYYKDTKDGSISWTIDAYEITNYEIKIFSNETDCLGEEYRKIDLTTPKYNNHHGMPYCNDNKEYYCAEFITQEINMTEEQLKKRAEEDELKRNSEERPNEEKKNKNFLEIYGIYIVLGITVVIVIGVCIRVLLVKMKRSKTI